MKSGGVPVDEDEVGGFPRVPAGPPYPDADRDGMADPWERANDFDPAFAEDGSRDADSDGFTNLEEFLNASDLRNRTPF